jgi:hypothetical protein
MTIISRQRRFVFVHLHKCGGTSIEKSYGEVAHWSDIVIGSSDIGRAIQIEYERKFGLSKHSSVQEIANVIGLNEYHDLEKFALIRDPFQIVESFYTWIDGVFRFASRKTGLSVDQIKATIAASNGESGRFHFSNWGASRAFSQSSTFAEFVDQALKNKWLPLAPLRSRLGVGTDLEPRFIYRLDQIDHLWNALETHLGIRLDRLHSNRSRKSHVYKWRAGHVSEIRKIFADDISCYDFTYEPTVDVSA